jgi:hypothetical protein
VLPILSKDEEHVSVCSLLNHSYLCGVFVVLGSNLFAHQFSHYRWARLTVGQYLLDCTRLIHVLDSRKQTPHHYFGFIQ